MEIALISLGVLIALLLCARAATAVRRHRRRTQRRRMVALGEALERDWLHPGLAADKRLPMNSNHAASLLEGSERMSDTPSLGWRLTWHDTARRADADYERYVRVRVLGRGAHGTVALLRDKKSGEQVAARTRTARDQRALAGRPLPAADVALLTWRWPLLTWRC
jgi:hypothetical protein